MARKIVEGGPIRFKDDLPIATPEIPRPLPIPPIDLVRDELTVWYKGRIFELDRKPAADRARIWNRVYGLREAEPASKREGAYLAAHAGAVVTACRDWLRRVVGDAAPSEQVVHAVLEKIEELCSVPLGAPRRDVGAGSVARSTDASVLAEVQGFERILLLDGKLYELVSLAEYLAGFEKAFAPELFASVAKEAARATPAEVCAMMRDNRGQMDKRTYGVIKGKVHYDDRTFELFLDGVYFVPVYAGKDAELLSKHRALFEKKLKVETVGRGG